MCSYLQGGLLPRGGSWTGCLAGAPQPHDITPQRLRDQISWNHNCMLNTCSSDSSGSKCPFPWGLGSSTKKSASYKGAPKRREFICLCLHFSFSKGDRLRLQLGLSAPWRGTWPGQRKSGSWIQCDNQLFQKVSNHLLEITNVLTLFFKRDPFAPLPEDKKDKLVVAMFAWDGNSYVGNEYWDGMLSASGDPAAACCSLIPEVKKTSV